jgi:hypothetical protein
MTADDRSKKAWKISGALVPAGLFIGMGVGWLFGHLVAGLFIGLGAGLLLMTVMRFVAARERRSL